jgi:SNF2 family DNA or RNA helicase
MNHIEIWKEKIILRWDRQLPPELQETYNSLPVEKREGWNDIGEVLKFWTVISKYAKYNEKFHAFLLTLSKQNLQRIHKQFGQIPVRRGQELIESLKYNLTLFKKMGELALKIKEMQPPCLDFKVRPLGTYQLIGTLFLTYVKRSPLFADCGTGKTYCALVSTESQIANGVIARGKTLICGKLATLETGWLEDTAKFTNLKSTILWLPQVSKRREKILALLDSPADVYLINHEGLMIFEKELASKRFQKIIVDESTVLKSYRGDFQQKGGKFGKALMNVAAHADWRVVMSGTPAPNGPEDLWGQFKFLDDDGFLLERSFFDFKQTYMKEVFFGKKDVPGTPSKWVCPRDKAEEIHNIITPYIFRVRIRDHLKDLPERTTCKRVVTMDDVQFTHYMSMKDALSTVLDDETISVKVKVSQIMKLRQITGGFLIDQMQVPHPINPNPKIVLMDTLLNDEIDIEHKVIIFAQYQWEVEMLQERYKHFGTVTVYGGNSADRNLKNIKGFIQDESIRIIILHPKSAAHGITFTHCHYMIFYSISHSAEENYQAIKRIERAGQKHPMFVYYLLAKSPDHKTTSIDEKIFDVIELKTRNQETLIDQDEFEQTLLSKWKE